MQCKPWSPSILPEAAIVPETANLSFVLLGLFLLLVAVIVFSMFKAPYHSRVAPKDYKLPKMEGETEAAEGGELDFIGHMNRGNEALGNYEYEKALRHYQSALKIKPTEATVHFKIGRIFMQREDYRNALVAFHNVIKINPEQIEGHYEIARVLFLQNKASDAHQALDHALKLKPDHSEALKLKIKLYEKENQWGKALPLLQQVMAQAKSIDYRRYRVQYADMLIKLERYSEAASEFETLLEGDPLDKYLYIAKLGDIFYRQKNYPQAIDYLRRIIQSEDPLSHEPNILSQLIAALCHQGNHHFKELQDPQGALLHFKEALAYDANNAQILFSLGRVYAEQGNLDMAYDHFSKSLAQNPMSAECAYELAYIEDQAGKVEPAIGHYLLALQLNPKNIHAAFGVGSLYGFKGDIDHAIHYLTEAVRLNPRHEDAIYNLGVALERQNKLNKATQMYKKVLSINRFHEQARSNLAHLQKMRGK